MDLRKAAAVFLCVLSIVCRVCAVAMGVLTVALYFPGVSVRLNLTGFVIDLSRALPDIIEGYGLVTSPFGGVFRTDFAITMLALFIADYIFQRVSRALRR